VERGLRKTRTGRGVLMTVSPLPHFNRLRPLPLSLSVFVLLQPLPLHVPANYRCRCCRLAMRGFIWHHLRRVFDPSVPKAPSDRDACARRFHSQGSEGDRADVRGLGPSSMQVSRAAKAAGRGVARHGKTTPFTVYCGACPNHSRCELRAETGAAPPMAVLAD